MYNLTPTPSLARAICIISLLDLASSALARAICRISLLDLASSALARAICRISQGILGEDLEGARTTPCPFFSGSRILRLLGFRGFANLVGATGLTKFTISRLAGELTTQAALGQHMVCHMQVARSPLQGGYFAVQFFIFAIVLTWYTCMSGTNQVYPILSCLHCKRKCQFYWIRMSF